MKVKLTLDRHASSSKKQNAMAKLLKGMGSKVTISGDVVVVDEGFDERKVVEIFNREGVDYARSRG